VFFPPSPSVFKSNIDPIQLFLTRYLVLQIQSKPPPAPPAAEKAPGPRTKTAGVTKKKAVAATRLKKTKVPATKKAAAVTKKTAAPSKKAAANAAKSTKGTATKAAKDTSGSGSDSSSLSSQKQESGQILQGKSPNIILVNRSSIAKRFE
jgi:hypothetical protein